MATSGGGHVYHHAKFRWTENLTCRFIQLRKEHGNMFTGRKYSAQAGWEYILRQMREEFPTIMADVHYRVLKKKWSNLLQQYKELKNPVHGDKNKADDISWPFYAAIDEVLGGCTASSERSTRQPSDEEDDDEMELNPQEFLCVSVENDEDEDAEEDEDDRSSYYYQGRRTSTSKVPGLEPLGRGHVFNVDRISGASGSSSSRQRAAATSRANLRKQASDESSSLLSRLPSATELTIRPIRRSLAGPGEQPLPPLEPIASANGRLGREPTSSRATEEPPRKRGRNEADDLETRLERRIADLVEYTKKRDEENRAILVRMLEAIEDIRNAVT